MMDEKPTVVSPVRARQAVTGHYVRYVLVVSMALVIIAFIGVAWFMRA